jgi:hypothetical protein
MTQLLVSVRSVAEAETALAGGADIIDVKEPYRGSLGKADDKIVTAIVEHVAARRPVSAALGELFDLPETLGLSRCDYIKVGLAGCTARSDWQERLAELASPSPPRLVAVAYADAARAQSPPVRAVLDFAIRHGCAALLIDTWSKDGRGLLHWLSIEQLTELRRACADARLPLAVAGSLLIAQIERLRAVEPDIIAVRTAACRAGRRDGEIDLARVQGLARICRAGQARRGTGPSPVLSTEYSVPATSGPSACSGTGCFSSPLPAPPTGS